MAYGQDKAANAFLKKYNTDLAKDGHFRGITKFDSNNLQRFNPLTTASHAFIIWTKQCPFVSLLPNGKELQKIFKTVTEKGFKSFSGINGIQLATETLTPGSTGNDANIATVTTDDSNSFGIKCYEFSGRPIGNYIELIMTGISDPKTKVATYHGLIADGIMEFAPKNHTMELLYVVTDNTELSTGIEYSCLITNILFTESPRDFLNFDRGNTGIVEIDINFTGVKYESPAINEIATKALASLRYNKTQLEYNPNILAFTTENFDGQTPATPNPSLASPYVNGNKYELGAYHSATNKAVPGNFK
ncbi:MAG: hypothetical protein ACRCXX_08165 [Cetobacterium sp.]|uniref:hypothetical protein n=1 Tax=Cetobacterium sp. TaxID=2071632 RepID=UPI003F2B0BBF